MSEAKKTTTVYVQGDRFPPIGTQCFLNGVLVEVTGIRPVESGGAYVTGDLLLSVYAAAARLFDPPENPHVMCVCGKHEVDRGADPYAAHREWVERRCQNEAKRKHTAVNDALGIGISAPPNLTLFVQTKHEDWV